MHRVLNGSNFATAVAKSGGDSPATETAEDEYDDMMPQDKPEVTLRRQRKAKRYKGKAKPSRQ